MTFRNILVGAIAGAMVGSTPVSADEYRQFLVASCAPEIGFFSIKNYDIYNVDPNALDMDDRHTASHLEEFPYTCKLSNDAEIVIKGYCRSRFIPEEINCGPGQSGREWFAVFVNGHILPLLDPPAQS